MQTFIGAKDVIESGREIMGEWCSREFSCGRKMFGPRERKTVSIAHDISTELIKCPSCGRWSVGEILYADDSYKDRSKFETLHETNYANYIADSGGT